MFLCLKCILDILFSLYTSIFKGIFLDIKTEYESTCQMASMSILLWVFDLKAALCSLLLSKQPD